MEIFGKYSETVFRNETTGYTIFNITLPNLNDITLHGGNPKFKLLRSMRTNCTIDFKQHLPTKYFSLVLPHFLIKTVK